MAIASAEPPALLLAREGAPKKILALFFISISSARKAALHRTEAAAAAFVAAAAAEATTAAAAAAASHPHSSAPSVTRRSRPGWRNGSEYSGRILAARSTCAAVRVAPQEDKPQQGQHRTAQMDGGGGQTVRDTPPRHGQASGRAAAGSGGGTAGAATQRVSIE